MEKRHSYSNEIVIRRRYHFPVSRSAMIHMFVLVQFLTGCNKLVSVPEPVETITTSETFSNPANATSAILAIYSDMSYGQSSLRYGNGATSIICGMTADELIPFGNGASPYLNNKIISNDGEIGGAFWSAAYFDIYMANAALEGISASATLTLNTKNQLIGEAKFLRGFIYFYLINLFGDVPLVTTTSYATTSLLPKTPVADVYKQIMEDLKDAQDLLPSDYSASGGQRIRANSYAATAMLARAYLYQQEWKSADSAASVVIDNATTYALDSSLSNVFLANSTESILQIQTANTYPYSTQEGQQFIPFDSTSNPNYYLTPSLLGSFEPGDRRRAIWVDSSDYSGTYYYYPFKYQVLIGNQGSITENYMLLRLAEQYLIRAEARAEENTDLNSAVADINVIRSRAGLPNLPGSLDQAQVLAAVAQERRLELFAEWGNRWLDLKRTGIAAIVLSFNKGITVSSNSLLYPIPLSEITADPNLTQNLGY